MANLPNKALKTVWQTQPEPGADVLAIDEFKGPSVRAGDRGAQGEAQPGAAAVGRAGVTWLREADEERPAALGRHTRPSVGDLDVPAIRRAIAAEGDRRARGGMADGVVDQIVEDSPEESWIGCDRAG